MHEHNLQRFSFYRKWHQADFSPFAL